jgi:hypothetical protein
MKACAIESYYACLYIVWCLVIYSIMQRAVELMVFVQIRVPLVLYNRYMILSETVYALCSTF